MMVVRDEGTLGIHSTAADSRLEALFLLFFGGLGLLQLKALETPLNPL
jgi:hypothetical protein